MDRRTADVESGYLRAVRRTFSTGKKTWLSAFIALAMVLAALRATAATDPRELRAREDFAAGRYQDALELFAKLYAESLHPNYLRNIGRCYQNLREPDRAITSFRDYLRKAKAITPDERKEVEGFISEMEELKRQKEAAASSVTATATATPATTDSQPVTPLLSQSAKAPGANANVSVLLTAPPPPPPAESPPVYERWWFWAIVGGAIAAGLGAAAAAGVFTRTQEGSCAGYKC
jgi:tetratricopeptide (TPR) repeat protein